MVSDMDTINIGNGERLLCGYDPDKVSDASHREIERIVCLNWKWGEEEGKERGNKL